MLSVVCCSEPSSADPTVIADDASDSYVVTGAWLISSTWTGQRAQREEAARCAGCRWRVESSCRRQGMSCGSGSWQTCPPGTVRYDVLRLTRTQAFWRFVGTTCLGSGGPVTIARINAEVAAVARARLEQPVLSAQRALVRGVLATLNLGAPTQAAMQLSVLGTPVVITAQADVTWRWGDGAVSHGQSWVMSHTWSRAGRYQVVSELSWRAAYSADGLSPRAVEQTITQRCSIPVQVLNARPVLL